MIPASVSPGSIQLAYLLQKQGLSPMARVPHFDLIQFSAEPFRRQCRGIAQRNQSTRFQHFDQFGKQFFANSPLNRTMRPVAKWTVRQMGVKWENIPKKNIGFYIRQSVPNNSRRLLLYAYAFYRIRHCDVPAVGMTLQVCVVGQSQAGSPTATMS